MRCPRGGVNHALMAVQHIACAVFLRGRANVRKIIATLWFRIGKCDDDVAANDFWNDGIGNRAANSLQRTTAKNDGLQIRFDRDDLTQFFHDQSIFEVAAAKSAMGFAK